MVNIPIQARHIPTNARRNGALAAAGWASALALFAAQHYRLMAVEDGPLQFGIYWMLACVCVGFWITFMRPGRRLIQEDWRIAYEVNPAAVRASAYDRRLDRVLARGLGNDRAPEFWPPGTWRILAWVGAAFWSISAAYTVALWAGVMRMPEYQTGILLVILLVPAVNCTAAAIDGPDLTRMLRLRDAARKARRNICEQSEVNRAMRILKAATPEQLALAEELNNSDSQDRRRQLTVVSPLVPRLSTHV